MKNSTTQQVETTVRNMSDKFMGMLRDVGSEAWDELKQGIDKAWDEIKIGVDEGLSTASQSFNKAWKELAVSIDRAKDQLLMKEEGESESGPMNVPGRRASGKIRKEKLS